VPDEPEGGGLRGAWRRLNPVVKIVVESILVFGLCLVLYFVVRGL
jgi:hypothetical protein